MLEHSKTWVNFNYACVLSAYGLMAGSLILMDVNIATKGFWAMGIVFLSGSLVTLVKTLTDVRLQSMTSEKVARARQDQLLTEYAQRGDAALAAVS